MDGVERGFALRSDIGTLLGETGNGELAEFASP
jgi:hypothetical protein